MRYTRQSKILELIETHEIETQQKLASLLRKCGYEVTQATISRDVKELQLIKAQSPNGKSIYAAGIKINAPATDRFIKIFKETVKSIEAAGNLIVIKTLSGCASAAAETLDALHYPHVVGSIAGDNTFMVIADDPANVSNLVDEFTKLLK